jgi:hypothetical protein
MLNKSFTAKIQKDKTSGWTCVLWPASAGFFGTGKPVKVAAAIEGHDFQATFLPTGGGVHMLPLKAAVMKAIGTQLGDTATVHLKERL